ncbi:MAG: hypothetical protein INR73_08200 [Williamsia sp.]|nr:hypothetical protein [Williamsia sp.]
MDKPHFQLTVAFGEKICKYRVYRIGIGKYKVQGRNRSVTITLDHKLLDGQMNQFCVNILAEAIRYKEFYKPEAMGAASQRSTLLKKLNK